MQERRPPVGMSSLLRARATHGLTLSSPATGKLFLTSFCSTWRNFKWRDAYLCARREERKTNGTDWFPAAARATWTRWQLRKRAPGLKEAGNTRTPVNNPIKMDRKRTPGTLSAATAAVVVIIALPLPPLRLLHCCIGNCATVSA